jgi:hypothetical protein
VIDEVVGAVVGGEATGGVRVDGAIEGRRPIELKAMVTRRRWPMRSPYGKEVALFQPLAEQNSQ